MRLMCRDVMLQDILIGEFYPMFVASHFVTEEDMKGRGSNKIGTQNCLFYLESSEKISFYLES